MTNLEELQRLVTEVSGDAGIPGAAVGVIFDGETHTVTTGVTSVDAPVDVDERTLFMIGSTTKTVTATAVLSLVDDGAIDLDTPIATAMPDLALADAVARTELSLRHLLTHSGGFEGDVADSEDWGDDALARSVATYSELAQYTPPGAAFSYSNAGLRLVGRLIEVLTGQSYESAVRQRVLEPLGMTESFFFPWEVYSRRHAVGHANGDDGAPTVAHTWGLGRSAMPEGGLVSSVADQLKYLRFHLDGTSNSPVLSNELRLDMQREQLVAAPPFDGVGMPWLLTDMFGTTAVTHGGNVAGIQRSTVTILPDAGFAVTVLANAGGGGALGQEVTKWCFENLLGRTENPPFESAPRSDAELLEYRGKWDSGTWGMDLEPSSGGLKATFFLAENLADDVKQLPPPMQLGFSGRDELIFPPAPESLFGRFERNSAGHIVRLLCQGRALRRVDPA